MMLRRLLKFLALSISVLLLIATGLWLFGETRWGAWTPNSSADSFIHGAIGLEVFPLKYGLVLEDVSGAAFRTGREDGRSLWGTYGFIENPRAESDTRATCVENAAEKMPVGIGISNYMPGTAIVTPVAFAGLTCAACHSAELRLSDGRKVAPIYGAANQELDIIGWTDGVRSAVLDPSLSAQKILDAYDARCGVPSGLYDRTIGRLIEQLLISAWLDSARASIGGDLSRYDLPFAGAKLKEAALLPAGPGRTRPFRSVVRTALNLPGAENMALSKIPVVFEQSVNLRPYSQYDGSIRNPTTRSMIAAFASGASIEALSKPEVVHNIASAAAFTDELGSAVTIPRYRDLFPDKAPDPRRVAEGFAVYQRACNGCHGNRPAEDAAWSLVGADRIHRVMPVAPTSGQPGIGTDPARLTFRYADMLPLAVSTLLPRWSADLEAQKEALATATAAAQREGDLSRAFIWQQQLQALNLASRKYRLGHPLAFAPDEIRYSVGYINNPIPRAFLRAPYSHNGSVPTLRQLINLDRRMPVFCRGENAYDPDAVGIAVTGPDAGGHCPDRQPFRFDTATYGNANTGHDFPWSYEDPARDPQALEDLLEYLKAL